MAKDKPKATIPVRFRKVNIRPYVEAIRLQVRSANGRTVLIKDMHLGKDYHLGRIEDRGDDAQCYNFVKIWNNGDEKRMQMHYNNLEGLMVGLIQGE